MKRMNRRWSDIPQEEVEELARQMTEAGTAESWMTSPNDPDAIERLKGRKLDLLLEEGVRATLEFPDEDTMVWSWDGVEQMPCGYGAACVPGLPDVIFLHLYWPGHKAPQCFEAALDLATGFCTVIVAKLGQLPEYPREVTRTILFGEIDSVEHPAGAEPHAYTKDLVGRAILWEMPAFTKKPPIKHIYLSPEYYAIFMTRDDSCFMSADPADYVRIRDGLYLVSIVEERRSGIQLSFLINTDDLEDVVGHFGISTGNEVGEDKSKITCTMMRGRKGEFVPMETLL